MTYMLAEDEELTASEAKYAQGEYRLTNRVRYGSMFLFILFLCDASTPHWNFVESPAFFDSDRYVSCKEAMFKHTSSP